MKVPFSFSVLRYVHDPVSQEFMNVGVAVYSPKGRYVGAMCTSRYRRLSEAFAAKVDGGHFRRLMDYIQARTDEFGKRLAGELPLEKFPESITELTKAVLPPDDSALQFGPAGSGMSGDLDATLESLFERYVSKYYDLSVRPTRDENDVWKVFKQPLEQKRVIEYLKPHKVVAANYEHDFNYAWKNEQWHTLQPLSFDLLDPSNIVDKANIWVGRAHSLSDTKEKFKLYFLLGLPSDSKLRKAYVRAENILKKMDGKPEFIKEDEAEDFAEEFHKQIEAHNQKG